MSTKLLVYLGGDKMSNSNFKAGIALKNQKLKFKGVSESNSTRSIAFDYSEPLGDGDGFRGLELLLLSFGGCVSTAIVFLLRRQGKNIDTFKMNLEGVKKENPLSIEKILFEIEIASDNISTENMQVVIKNAEAVSPVWNMIKGNTKVEGSFILKKNGDLI